MFTIYEGKVYKVNGKTMVGVDITPTSLKMVKGTEIDTPNLNKILTLKEVKIKYHVVNGASYIFPKPTKKKVDKDKPTTKTKKSTTKKKVDKDGDEPTTTKTKKSTGKSN